MARQKRITKSKIKKIVPQISKVLAEYSSNEDELNVLMSKMESVLNDFVSPEATTKQSSSDDELAGGLSGVVNPRNIGSTGAKNETEGFFVMQKNLSEKQDVINNRGT